MGDVFLGLIALIAGVSLCFRGYLAMRLLIPIWGALAGFSLGAGLVAAIAGERFLATVTGWIVGLVVAVVFAAFAYLYYAVSVAVLMGSAGFALGTAAMVALGVRWNWLVILVAVVCGLALALAAIAMDLPMLLLVLVTATTGALAITAALMLFAGALSTDDLTRADIVDRIRDEWWTYAMYLVLTVAGIVSQVRLVDHLSLSMREAWDAA